MRIAVACALLLLIVMTASFTSPVAQPPSCRIVDLPRLTEAFPCH